MNDKRCESCLCYNKSFHKDLKSKDGLKTVCVDCRKDSNPYKRLTAREFKGAKKKEKIIKAAIKLLESGAVVSYRNIVKLTGDKNTGVVAHHFGTMSNLLIIVDNRRSEIEKTKNV